MLTVSVLRRFSPDGACSGETACHEFQVLTKITAWFGLKAIFFSVFTCSKSKYLLPSLYKLRGSFGQTTSVLPPQDEFHSPGFVIENTKVMSFRGMSVCGL